MAEGARLESVYTLTGIGGSNPSLSASTFWEFSPLWFIRKDIPTAVSAKRGPAFAEDKGDAGWGLRLESR